MRQPRHTMPSAGPGLDDLGLVLSLVCALALGPLLTGCSAAESSARGQEQDESASATESPAPESLAEEPSAGDLLPNGILVEDGLLVGGQPSAEQLEELARAGYKTVINLRTEGEGGTDREAVEALGMDYVSLPVAGADGMSEENARALASILEDASGPAVLHCGSGNRVGGLLALKAFYVDGASVDEALRYGLDAGLTRLEGTVRERLEAASDESDG